MRILASPTFTDWADLYVEAREQAGIDGGDSRALQVSGAYGAKGRFQLELAIERIRAVDGRDVDQAVVFTVAGTRHGAQGRDFAQCALFAKKIALRRTGLPVHKAGGKIAA